MSLNESIKSLGNRFESFSQNIENKVNRVNGEMVLLKNRVQVLESTIARRNAQEDGSIGMQSRSIVNTGSIPEEFPSEMVH